jgi:hypothetical protein
MRRCRCGHRISPGRWVRDFFLELQAVLWSAVVVLAWVGLLAGPGCTSAQLASLGDGLVGLKDCSLHSSLGCAAQAMAGCATPEASDGMAWGSYGDCLAQKSMACGSKALALCSYRAISVAAGGPVVMGGVGCNDEKGRAAVRATHTGGAGTRSQG